MRLRQLLPALAIAIGCVVAPCHADWMYCDLQGVGKGLWGLELSYDGTTLRGFAGEIKYEINNDGETIKAFCVDLAGRAQDGFAESVGLDALLGGDTADYVGALYATHYSDSAASNVAAAAFQLAIWEIIADGANNADLGGGNFFVRNGDGDGGFGGGPIGEAVELAGSWISDIFGSEGWDLMAFAGGSQFQDFVYIPISIPLPAPILLAGLGLIGVVVGRKHLQRALGI